MRLYRKVIKPYRNINGKRTPIPGFSRRWFKEELISDVRNKLKENYEREMQREYTMFEFLKEYHLCWRECFLPVEIQQVTTDMEYVRQLIENKEDI